MDIKRECESIVENYISDILWYLNELPPNQRKDFTLTIKTDFCEMVDNLLKEINEDE